MERAAANNWRVYLLGGAPGVADKAAAAFRARGIQVVGVDDPTIHDPSSAPEREPIIEKIRRAAPHVVLVALGAPKQELFIQAARPELPGAVMLGIGASLGGDQSKRLKPVGGKFPGGQGNVAAHAVSHDNRLFDKQRIEQGQHIARHELHVVDSCRRRALAVAAEIWRDHAVLLT